MNKFIICFLANCFQTFSMFTTHCYNVMFTMEKKRIIFYILFQPFTYINVHPYIIIHGHIICFKQCNIEPLQTNVFYEFE